LRGAITARRRPYIRGMDVLAIAAFIVLVLPLSILVHEAGHAAAMRALGERGEIVISLGARAGSGRGFRYCGFTLRFGLAPLAYAHSSQAADRTPAKQLAVSLAGPGANIALGAICLACPAGGLLALFGWVQLVGGAAHLALRSDGRRALRAYRAWREQARG